MQTVLTPTYAQSEHTTALSQAQADLMVLRRSVVDLVTDVNLFTSDEYLNTIISVFKSHSVSQLKRWHRNVSRVQKNRQASMLLDFEDGTSTVLSVKAGGSDYEQKQYSSKPWFEYAEAAGFYLQSITCLELQEFDFVVRLRFRTNQVESIGYVAERIPTRWFHGDIKVASAVMGQEKIVGEHHPDYFWYRVVYRPVLLELSTSQPA